MLAHLATVAECLNFTAEVIAAAARRNASSRSGVGSGGGSSNSAVTYFWITCVLGYLNSATNGFSLIVFILDKKNIIMRRLLLLLSLSETVLNICLAVNFTVLLRMVTQRSSHNSFGAPSLITAVSFMSFTLFNAYIMIRNWCLVMIAGSRCEVVHNPLSTRSGQLFSPTRTLVGYVALSLVSLLINSPRLFEFTWTVYQQPCNMSSAGYNATAAAETTYLLTTRVHHVLDALPKYNYYKTLLLFPMQTVVPIFLISGLSFLIIFTLRRRQFPMQQAGSLSAASHRSQDAATKTVMVLLICFVVFELPTFLFFVLNRTVLKSLDNHEMVRLHTTFIGNILVCLDSFSNFIVYSSTSNTFRETVRRILRLPGTKSAPLRGGGGGGISGNYSMIRSVNTNLRHLSWTPSSARSVRRPIVGRDAAVELALTPTPTPTPVPTPTSEQRQRHLSSGKCVREDDGFV